MGAAFRNVCFHIFIYESRNVYFSREQVLARSMPLKWNNALSFCQLVWSLSSAPLTISHRLYSVFLSLSLCYSHFFIASLPHFTLYALSQPQHSSPPPVSYSGQKMSHLPGLIWGIQVAEDWDRGWRKGQLFHSDKRLCSCLKSDIIQPDL